MRRELAVCLVGLAFLSNARADIRTLVISGDPAPHASAGETFYNFQNVQFNNRGDVGFLAQLADASGKPIYFYGGDGPQFDLTPDVGIWVLGASDSRLIVRQGHPAPASPPGEPVWLVDPTDSDDQRYGYQLSNAGVLLQALTGPLGRTPTLWLMPREGAVVPIAKTGTPVPGGSMLFSAVGVAKLTDSGTALFPATESQSGIWGGDPGAYSRWTFSSTGGLIPIVRTQMPAAGIPDPAVYGAMFYAPLDINEQGTSLFGSDVAPSLAESSITTSGSSTPNGLWRVLPSGEVSLIAYSENEDVYFGRINEAILNASGDIAVHHGHSVSLFRNGERRLLARGDLQVPGVPGATFNRIESIALSDSGKVAVTSLMYDYETASYVGVGLWEDTSTGLVPVVVGGTAAPTGDGSILGSVDGHSLSMNSAGQILFMANVRQPEAAWRPGLFAEDRAGNLHTIAVAGESLMVADGDLRTLLVVRDAAINDRGEVMFHAYFNDDSQGIFISKVVAVPEPAGWFIGSLTALLALMSCRRHSGKLVAG